MAICRTSEGIIDDWVSTTDESLPQTIDEEIRRYIYFGKDVDLVKRLLGLLHCDFDWEGVDHSEGEYKRTVLHMCIGMGEYNRGDAKARLPLFRFLVDSGAHSCLFMRDIFGDLGGHYADVCVIDGMREQQISVIVWAAYLDAFISVINIKSLAEIMRSFLCGNYSPTSIIQKLNYTRDVAGIRVYPMKKKSRRFHPYKIGRR